MSPFSVNFQSSVDETSEQKHQPKGSRKSAFAPSPNKLKSFKLPFLFTIRNYQCNINKPVCFGQSIPTTCANCFSSDNQDWEGSPYLLFTALNSATNLHFLPDEVYIPLGRWKN